MKAKTVRLPWWISTWTIGDRIRLSTGKPGLLERWIVVGVGRDYVELRRETWLERLRGWLWGMAATARIRRWMGPKRRKDGGVCG